MVSFEVTVFLIVCGVFVVLAAFAVFSFLTSSFFTATLTSSTSLTSLTSSFSGWPVTFLSLCLPLRGAEKVSEDLMKSRGKMPTSPSKRFLVTCSDLRPGNVTSFFSCRMRTLSASWLAWKRLKGKMCFCYVKRQQLCKEAQDREYMKAKIKNSNLITHVWLWILFLLLRFSQVTGSGVKCNFCNSIVWEECYFLLILSYFFGHFCSFVVNKTV